MKNNLIKSILVLLTFVLLMSETFAGVIGPNIKVKLDGSGTETYTTSLNGISNQDTILNFEIVGIFSGATPGNYSISMPIGFEYISKSEIGATCTQNVTNSTNANFSFSVSSVNQPCTSKFILTYKVKSTTLANNYRINIIDINSGSETSALNLGITNLYSLINSETLDINANGFIDRLRLVFNTSILSSFSNNNLTIGTLIPTLFSTSGDTAYISINDNTYKTGEKPTINDTDGNIFANIGTILNVVPTDKANPILETINGLSTSSNISITSTGNIVLKFSEQLLPSSNVGIYLKNGTITIPTVNSFSGLDTLIIDPVSSLSAGTYTITSEPTIAKDWSLNGNSLTISLNTLIVPDTVSPVGQAVGTSNGISINSGNTKTNNTNVQLNLLATDNILVTSMKIGNQSNLSDGVWENYSTTKLNYNLIGTLGINTVYVQFRDNAGNVSSIYSDTIEYDNSNDYVAFDNIVSNYTNQSTFTLNGTCNFTGAIVPNLEFKNGATIVGTGTCNSTTKTFSNTFNISEGQNTIEAYFSGTSISGSIDVYKDTTAPVISFSPVNTNSNSQINVVISSDDNYNIYYTTDGTTANSSSTVYTNSFVLNQNKTIKYYSVDGLGNIASGSKLYTFSCASIPNGTVTTYPTCSVITCNSGYVLSGSSCIIRSGGGGGGGGGSVTVDYENIKYLDNTKITLDEILINKSLVNKYGILDINSLSSKQITGDNGILTYRSSFKGLSTMTLSPNTSIIGDIKSIYAPYNLDVYTDLKTKTLKINNIDLKYYYIKKLFFAGNIDQTVSFNNDVELKLDLGGKVEGKMNIYYSEKTDGNFTLLHSGVETDENGFVTFKTNKLGYFIFVRDIYVSNYLGGQTISFTDINTAEQIAKLITSLQSQVTNTILKRIIDKYAQVLIIPEIDYYLSFDSELQTKYNNIIKGFSDFILNLEKYVISKDKESQIAAINGYKEYLKYKELNNFDNKYITKTNRNGLVIYKTKYTPIIKLVDALENAMIIKLGKLLDANTITQEQYNQTIKDYNEFILHLSIYRQYNNKAAALKALTPGKAFLKVYKMNIVYKTIISEDKPIINNPVQEPINEPIKQNIILIKDKYTFPIELKFGDYNEYVRNLQEILKTYGYFNHPQTTQYFGEVTKASLINFSKDMLNTSNPDGILTKDLIEKLYLIEYK